MGLTYFKRFRMELDLVGRVLPRVDLPPSFSLAPWTNSLQEAHAETKYLSFRGEIDSNVFPCLGEFDGCCRLMDEISHKDGFLPGATWIAICSTPEGAVEYCGTIQGVRDHAGLGAIQNLGVVPEYRGRGLGRALLIKAMEGFQKAGLRRAFLEVTAQNEAAIRLYQHLGFVKSRTVYKAVEVAYS